MQREGRSVAQQKNFLELLCTNHQIAVRVLLLDLDMNQVPGGEISTRLESGQVTVDADGEITRSLDLELFDPDHALHLDTDSPAAGALFADRMIRIRYTVIDPLGLQRFSTNIFTGPITKLDRNESVVSVQCLGKEIFGLATEWNSRTWKKGASVTRIIRELLSDHMGEGDYEIPEIHKKIPRDISVGGDKRAWPTAKALAATHGYQLYFDGSGVCRMRKFPKSSCFTFRGGTGGALKSEPAAGFDIDAVINAVEVFGKQPQQKAGQQTKKKRPHAKAVAARSHPLSPWKLGRKGGPRFLPYVLEDDGVENDAEAKRRAKQILDRALLESVEVSYDIVAIALLEEMDVVTVKSSKFQAKHRAKQFVIGLNSGSDSTMGYVRNVKPNSSKIRRRHRKKRKNH